MSVRLFTLFCFSTMLMVSVAAQDKQAFKYGKTITIADLRAELSVLAHDSLEGRETGEPGQYKAAQYIASRFKAMGLVPPVKEGSGRSYFQKLPLKRAEWVNLYLRKGDEKAENLDGFVYFAQAETVGEEYAEAIFIGEGSSIDDLDLEGRFVAAPNGNLSEALLEKIKAQGAVGTISLISQDSEFNSLTARAGRYFRPRLRFEFEDQSAKLIILNPEKTQWLFGKPMNELQVGDQADFILNADKLISPKESMNVLGYLKGS